MHHWFIRLSHVQPGSALVFLDSHCEANINWLDPLVDPIRLNSRTVVTPVIDNIDKETMDYHGHQSNGLVGIFNWGLEFKWESRHVPEPDVTLPFE